MSALLMAIAINGMTAEEMATLTQAMLRSGEQWHLRDSYDFIADKHSTGGVGDKVSLVLSPWVAACGVKIGMLSGRGLGPHWRDARQARGHPRLQRPPLAR